MTGLSRRQLLRAGLALAGIGLLSGCDLPRLPWQPARVARVGYLTLATERASTAVLDVLRQELRSLGYVEGQSLILEARYADDRADQLPGLADELVRMPVDVIVTTATQAALAAKQATTSVPIVMATGGDPVGAYWTVAAAASGGIPKPIQPRTQSPTWSRR